MKISAYSYCVLAIIVIAALPMTAKADHSDPFVQVTCAPDLGYFQLKTFQLGDTDWASRKSLGIYSLEDFSKMNYQCRSPENNISIHLVEYRNPGADPRGPASHCLVDDATFDVRINGVNVYRFSAYNHCAGAEHEITFTQISNFNDTANLRDCIIDYGFFSHPSLPKYGCDEIDLKNNSKKAEQQ